MNILCVGSHWDDIEIGCGGTVLRHVEQGHTVFGVVLTGSDYEVEHHQHSRDRVTATQEGIAAFAAMGVQHVLAPIAGTNQLVYGQRIMRRIEEIVRVKGVTRVYTHWPGDHNDDHQAAWRICRVACRNIPTLLGYASNAYSSDTVFTPRLFVGFTAEEYRHKQALMQLYATEWAYRQERWQSEIFAREKHWGQRAGHDFAEGFQVLRMQEAR